MEDQSHGNVPSAPAGTRSKPWRRVFFLLILCGFTYGLCEALAWVYMVSAPDLSIDSLRGDQQSLASGGAPVGSQTECLHPYAGWVLNPQVNSGSQGSSGTLPINRWGLYGRNDEISRRSPDRLIIGVAGGSVAWQMTRDAEEKFVRVLQEDPAFAGRQIEIVRLAMPGYKQPQQLTLLSYLLSLGFEFDAVVNIDGYNEAALTICENFDRGVALAYPRSWHARMQDVVDPRTFAVSHELLEIRARRQRDAQKALDSRFHWSPLRNILWKLRDARFEVKLVELGESLLDKRERTGRGFAADGPASDDLEADELDAEVLAIWERSTRQLHNLCRANDAVYLHCLQPNQYLEGSKPLSPQEQEDFFDPDQCAGQVVNRLYPQMIAIGDHLRAEGIAFQDLTRIFSGIEGTIYMDCWCHYNDRGNDILAETVARRLQESWSRSTTPEE